MTFQDTQPMKNVTINIDFLRIQYRLIYIIDIIVSENKITEPMLLIHGNLTLIAFSLQISAPKQL